MYDVPITNNYFVGLFLDGGNQTIAQPNGGKAQFTNWGSNAINVPWMGDINFMDMGDQKLSGYTNPKIPWTESTWGGLVRYQASTRTFATRARARSDSWWIGSARSAFTSSKVA